MPYIRQCQLLDDLLEYIYKIIELFLYEYMTSIGSFCIPSSSEFLFFYPLLQLYADAAKTENKKVQIDMPFKQCYEEMDYYNKFMEDIYLQFFKVLRKSQHVILNRCHQIHNEKLLSLFGFISLPNISASSIWTVNSPENDKIITSMLNHSISLPFISYHLFQWTKYTSKTTLKENFGNFQVITTNKLSALCKSQNFKMLKSILEIVPIYKPKLIQKIALSYKGLNEIQKGYCEDCIHKQLALLSSYFQSDPSIAEAYEFVFKNEIEKKYLKNSVNDLKMKLIKFYMKR